MVSLPILEDLPSGYFVDESPRGILALHADVTRILHEAGFGPEQDGALADSELSGRRPLHEIHAGDERLVIRCFSHGGLMRWITGIRYRDPERPFRELILSDSLRRAGILTPQVVAARARMARGGGWYLDLVTRRVEDAIDLGYVLGQARSGQLTDGARRALLVAAGNLVRQLHRHGCLHSDLTPTNILAERASLEEKAEPRLWVIDLDESVRFEDLTPGARLGNLRRLFRYTSRRDRRLGKSLNRSDYLRFLVAYEPDREKRKEIWRAVATAHKRSRFIHALGWLFEGWFGRGTDPREISPA